MTYSPSNWVVERLRQMFKRRVRDAELAYLGDSHGEGARVDVPGLIGFVYVHFPNGKDENGFALYGPPIMARSGSAAYLNAPGMPVFVAYNDGGELEIKGAQYAAVDAAGFDTRVLNPLNQQSKFVYPWQLTYGLASAVANSITTSFLVTVKKFYHLVGNKLEAFDTPLEADKVDMEPYIPAVDMHCYAAVWIDTFLNTAVVVTSVPQALTTPLDATDLQETVVRAAASRPPDGVPLKAFYLANNQGTLQQSSLEVDIRQHMDMPKAWGFPNVLSTLERVWPNRTLVVGPYTTTGVGDLDDSESGAQVLIVHKSNVTNTAPTTGDDSGDGYSIGSRWFDTATGTLYIASDVSVGAAVWDDVVSGSGGTVSNLVMPTAEFDVSGNGTATVTVTWDDQLYNTFLAAPSGGIGTDGQPSFRAIEIYDLPLISIDHLDASVIYTDTVDPTSADAAAYESGSTWINLTGNRIWRMIKKVGPVATWQLLGQIMSVVDSISWLSTTTSSTGAVTIAAATGQPQNQVLASPDGSSGTVGLRALVSADIPATLSGKTLTTPTIADFTNAQHDHQDADDGGQLTGAAVNVTAHNAVIGNGASGLTSLAPGANRNVMISDGTDWTSRALALADVPNLIAILRDEKTSGTNGGTSVNTTWNARDLNTELYDPGGIVSISSNQFTPIAGDYAIEVFTPFFGGSAAASTGRCRLYNVTGAAVIEEGMSAYAVVNGYGLSVLQCKFTANGTDAYRIDTYTSVGKATNGLGPQVGDGSPEVYTCILLRKIA